MLEKLGTSLRSFWPPAQVCYATRTCGRPFLAERPKPLVPASTMDQYRSSLIRMQALVDIQLRPVRDPSSRAPRSLSHEPKICCAHCR